MAAGFAYAERVGKPFAVDLAKTFSMGLCDHTKSHYVNSIFRKFARVSETPRPYSKVVMPFLQALVYQRLPDFPAEVNVYIEGLFICEKYFEKVGRQFVEMLTLPEVPSRPGCCFIHIRRGDTLSNAMNRLLFAYDYNSYVESALELVRRKRPGTRFCVFSDDLPWCRNQAQFAGDEFEFIDEPDAVLALVRMSHCRVGGICWNSTFSWWGAYLNDNPDKIVVAPMLYSKWVPQNPWPSGAYILPCGNAQFAFGPVLLLSSVFGLVALLLLVAVVVLACYVKPRGRPAASKKPNAHPHRSQG